MTATLNKNLAIVDNMISMCEKSVREDPQNEMTRDYLYTAYQQKADLLATMADSEDDDANLLFLETDVAGGQWLCRCIAARRGFPTLRTPSGKTIHCSVPPANHAAQSERHGDYLIMGQARSDRGGRSRE